MVGNSGVPSSRGARELAIKVCHHQPVDGTQFSGAPEFSPPQDCFLLKSGLRTLIMGGTSRSYIIDRLRREKLDHLADAVERGEASAFEIAVELGWQRRRGVTGRGSENEAKRRAWRLRGLGL